MRFRQIVRFNWPYYVAAGAAVLAAFGLARWIPLAWMRAWLSPGAPSSRCGWSTSLVVSWIVYDRSRLMDWDWVLQALGFRPAKWINLHAGHEDSTPALREIFKEADGRVFDIYDPREMTEPSIATSAPAGDRGRRSAPTSAVCRCPRGPSTWPCCCSPRTSCAATKPATPCLPNYGACSGPGGRVVVAEHMRDWANFLAFGPGFLHFHSRRTWVRCFSRHRFDIHCEFSITPFVRIFVLRRLT